MFLNIKILCISLLLSLATFAQEKATDTIQKPETKGRKVGNVTIGAYVPIAFGDNYVNNGMDLKPGARFAFKINILQDFYAGPNISVFGATISDRELLGNYSHTTNFLAGGMIGYEKQVNKFDLSIGLGVGVSVYASKAAGDHFNDTGAGLWLSPEASYRFATYWAVFVAPEIRHDFMNIDVPQGI